MIDGCTGERRRMADRKGTVVHAFGAAPPSQLQQEILDFIDEFVADIKTGRIVAVAVAGVISDGGVSSGWRRSPKATFV